MDAAQVLENYLCDVANLPTDVAYIMDEIQVKHERLVECQKRAITRDLSIQKYVRSHGSLVENPRENLAPKISADYRDSLAIQREKCNLANTGLFIISRHVKRLQAEIDRLEAEGQVEPADNTPAEYSEPELPTKSMNSGRRASELKRSNPVISGSGAAPGRSAEAQRPQKKQKIVGSHSKNPSAAANEQATGDGKNVAPGGLNTTNTALASSEALAPAKTEHRGRANETRDEDTSYCVCRGPSFGTMVGCDNDDCKIEWFHYECVGLTEAPTGTWLCPDCRSRAS